MKFFKGSFKSPNGKSGNQKASISEFDLNIQIIQIFKPSSPQTSKSQCSHPIPPHPSLLNTNKTSHSQMILTPISRNLQFRSHPQRRPRLLRASNTLNNALLIAVKIQRPLIQIACCEGCEMTHRDELSAMIKLGDVM